MPTALTDHELAVFEAILALNTEVALVRTEIDLDGVSTDCAVIVLVDEQTEDEFGDPSRDSVLLYPVALLLEGDVAQGLLKHIVPIS